MVFQIIKMLKYSKEKSTTFTCCKVNVEKGGSKPPDDVRN